MRSLIVLGCLLVSCGDGSASSRRDDGAPSAPASVPVASGDSTLVDTIPSAPVHWTIPMFRTAMETGSFGRWRALTLDRPRSLVVPDTVILRHALVSTLDSAELLAVEMADPVSAGRTASELRRANPDALVFTSNNLIVAGTPGPRLTALRDSMTTLHMRSGRR